jgi:hypothetical protein
MLLTAEAHLQAIITESNLTDTEAKLIDHLFLSDGRHKTFTAFRLLHPEHENVLTISLKQERDAALTKLRNRMWANDDPKWFQFKNGILRPSFRSDRSLHFCR